MVQQYPYSTILEGNIAVVLHIYGARDIFYYFLFTRTLSWSNEKSKIVYFNKYSPRKISQALQNQGIGPLKHGIFLK